MLPQAVGYIPTTCGDVENGPHLGWGRPRAMLLSCWRVTAPGIIMLGDAGRQSYPQKL